eukprot:s2743_g5.t1
MRHKRMLPRSLQPLNDVPMFRQARWSRKIALVITAVRILAAAKAMALTRMNLQAKEDPEEEAPNALEARHTGEAPAETAADCSPAGAAETAEDFFGAAFFEGSNSPPSKILRVEETAEVASEPAPADDSLDEQEEAEFRFGVQNTFLHYTEVKKNKGRKSLPAKWRPTEEESLATPENQTQEQEPQTSAAPMRPRWGDICDDEVDETEAGDLAQVGREQLSLERGRRFGESTMSLDAPWRPALAHARLTRPASTPLKPRSACDPSDRRIGRSNFLQLLGATGAALFAGSRRCRAEDDLKMMLNKDFSCGGLELTNPRFLGGGVQGEVYQADLPGTGLVAVKISRRNDDYAKGTFAREQQVVKLLSDAQVPGVERCIAAGPVVTPVGQRQGLVMQPCLPSGKVISVKSGRGTPLFLEEDKRMEKLMKTAFWLDIKSVQSSPRSSDIFVVCTVPWRRSAMFAAKLRAHGARWAGEWQEASLHYYSLALPTPSETTAAVSACARQRQWQMAQEVLASARNLGHGRFDIASFNACLGAMTWPQAMAWLQKVRQWSLEPTIVTFNATIETMKRAHEWCRAVALLSEASGKSLQPNLVSYGTAVSACVAAAQWLKALELFHSVQAATDRPQRGRGGSGLVVLYSAAVRACETAAKWPEALELLQVIGKSRVKLDGILYNSVLSACDKGHRWEEALDTLSSAKQRCLENIVSYSATMSACAKGAQWQWALFLLSDLQDAKLHPNQVTYAAAISACEKGEGRWADALFLLQHLAPEQRDMVTSSAAISACEKSSQWMVALEIFRTLPEQDLVAYNATASACAKAQQWSKAMFLLNQAEEKQLQPTVTSYGTVISSFEESGRWPNALNLLWRMRVGLLQPNMVAFGSCVEVCRRSLRWNQAIQLLSEMEVAQLLPNLIVASSVVAVVQATQAPALKAVLEHLRRAVYVEEDDRNEPVLCALGDLDDVLRAPEERMLRRKVLEPVCVLFRTVSLGADVAAGSGNATNVTGFGVSHARGALNLMGMRPPGGRPRFGLGKKTSGSGHKIPIKGTTAIGIFSPTAEL